jgi:hypothetical protein
MLKTLVRMASEVFFLSVPTFCTDVGLCVAMKLHFGHGLSQVVVLVTMKGIFLRSTHSVGSKIFVIDGRKLTAILLT